MGASATPRYMIDTSVLIAYEQGRPLAELPESGTGAISVVTIGELHHGVLRARSMDGRARRLATYRRAVEMFDAVPIDETVAITWAEYEALLDAESRATDLADTWIAATAATHGMTVITQDRGFEWFPDLDVLIV